MKAITRLIQKSLGTDEEHYQTQFHCWAEIFTILLSSGTYPIKNNSFSQDSIVPTQNEISEEINRTKIPIPAQRTLHDIEFIQFQSTCWKQIPKSDTSEFQAGHIFPSQFHPGEFGKH